MSDKGSKEVSNIIAPSFSTPRRGSGSGTPPSPRLGLSSMPIMNGKSSEQRVGNHATESNGNTQIKPNVSSNGSGEESSGAMRRPSFGLSFFSSFTNSIRTHNPSGPSGNPNGSLVQVNQNTENMHNFMSNSPTIANLNNLATSSDNTTTNNNNNNNINNNDNTNNNEESNEYERRSSTTSESDQMVGSDNLMENNNTATQVPSKTDDQLDDATKSVSGKDKDGYFSVRLTPLIDHSTSASGLYFPPVIRKILPNSTVSIGRYTEKNKAAAHAPQGSSAPIVFKSKVVSRTHALFQCNEDGQWFLKDCKSSSGTFLNHIRLSRASEELTMMPIIDGDIIQLGMDYRGGAEEVYRCVKMRCEFNRSWQRKVNQFNIEIHNKLKNLQISNDSVIDPVSGEPVVKDELSECAICLLKLEPCQALFISPCSHSWHYKCIRPIIIKSYPQFYCPNCRSMCDLETDIEDEEE